jgi:hypothetical protein
VSNERRRTIVYVDGFNLYYGALKGTPHRWLNIGELCSKMLPQDEIVGIKYFTALVRDRPGRQGLASRQQTYLRALATIPHVSIHLGHFLTRPVRRALVAPPKGGPRSCEVWQTEEKGSDVNLASHMLVDGFRGQYELAVVVSNDSDLKEPVRLVREELTLPVGVLNPHAKRSWALSPRDLPRGSFFKPIRTGVLADSQFPNVLSDVRGRIRKPRRWNSP